MIAFAAFWRRTLKMCILLQFRLTTIEPLSRQQVLCIKLMVQWVKLLYVFDIIIITINVICLMKYLYIFYFEVCLKFVTC